jgi:conjugative relaxase-like TrwC/TraI family protein
MSIHKLSAGSGYDYLTRQVAALDATAKGHVGLASYYAERGESPGVWVGSGLAGVDGLEAGDPVTAEQMRALFGAGMHPLATQRLEQIRDTDLTDANVEAATRLGAPFKILDAEPGWFRVEVAKRIAAFNEQAGLPGDWPVSPAERARIRTQVARELFAAEHGRPPADARELAGTIAKHSRPAAQSVAGYDLTFSPVKSVSTLWAVADPQIAAQIERAHQAAVHDALQFLDEHALFTREGPQGIRQVNVRGMVAAAFTHRDSRAGDPDLHTHVAVANKVQTLDGRWLSIDGRVLFKATVAASETYNTALEHHLHDRLGVRFADRPDTDRGKRPIREIVGVDPALNQRWSTRRVLIKNRQGELAARFQRDHCRPPTPVEALQLAQQATLETRDAKHEPRALAEQRAAWHTQAAETLGGPDAVQAMISKTLNPISITSPHVDADWVAATAEKVLEAVEGRRSTWQSWHVRAEALRHVRAVQVPTDQVDQLVELLVTEALQTQSMSLTRPDDTITEPAVLRRADGSSVYTVAGSELFTSARILAAEQRLVATAGRINGHVVDAGTVELALLEAGANGVSLDAGQAALVRAMCTSGARLQLAIAPAGAGKTTAMRTLAGAWTDSGGHVVGLAPSAAAATQLHDATGAPAETLAKLTWSIRHGDLPDWVRRIGRSTLVIIDEAGMADTLSLDTAVNFIIGRGGSIRLVGDDQQLAAIGAGGVLRDIQGSHGAVRLTELHRFSDPAEAAATLALREGRPEALGFYLDRRRVHVGDPTTTLDSVFNAWQTDRSQGLDTIMLGPTRELVRGLNQRAQGHRLAGTAPGRQVELADGNRASVGDLVITRSNDRRLRVSATDWVKNGDRWTILNLTSAGGVRVRHARTGRIGTLPAIYVQTSVELGYATTVHAAQGVTADTMHGVVTGKESRQQLYTMITRGRTANHLYLSVVGDGNPHAVIQPDSLHPRTATELLEQILSRDATPQSATTLYREQHDPTGRLGAATARYLDALHLAAEQLAEPQVIAALEHSANGLFKGLTGEPAWPTLRGHLLLLAAAGADPVAELLTAAAQWDLTSARDQAAVIDSRIQDINGVAARVPLPWLPGIPHRLAADPNWGPYLDARSHLVAEFADKVRLNAEGEAPAWAPKPHTSVPAELIAEVRVWRAATQVDPSDLRPTGPPQLGRVARFWQQQLDKRLAAVDTHTDRQWRRLLATEVPRATADPFLPELEERLSNLARAGFDATLLVRSAAAAGPPPDDHPAAALWWRILDQLPETPNHNPATPAAVPATRRTTTTSHDKQRPLPRSARPRAFGPSL